MNIRKAVAVRRWAVLVALWIVATPQAADLKDAKIQAKLARGEIVIELKREPGTHVVVGTATGVIDAPREQVWAVIGDFNHFTEFMPSFKTSFMLKPDVMTSLDSTRSLKNQEPLLSANKLDRAASDTLLLYHCFNFPFPLGDRRCLLRMVRDGVNYYSHYDLVMGDFKIDEGSWQLSPYGDKTLAIYITRSDPGLAVPGFLLRIGTRHILPDVIQGVRKRVKG